MIFYNFIDRKETVKAGGIDLSATFWQSLNVQSHNITFSRGLFLKKWSKINHLLEPNAVKKTNKKNSVLLLNQEATSETAESNRAETSGLNCRQCFHVCTSLYRNAAEKSKIKVEKLNGASLNVSLKHRHVLNSLREQIQQDVCFGTFSFCASSNFSSLSDVLFCCWATIRTRSSLVNSR